MDREKIKNELGLTKRILTTADKTMLRKKCMYEKYKEAQRIEKEQAIRKIRQYSGEELKGKELFDNLKIDYVRQTK